MSSWSKRRKLTYISIVTVVIFGVVIIPAFLIFYKAPTCSDGKKNGNETGIDCGGSCTRLCQSSFLPASVAWTRFEEVAPGLYNVAAYIVNPNTDGEAINAPYHIVLYDSQGIEITDMRGIITIPPHRNTLAFRGAVSVGTRIPAKAFFEFTSPPDWTVQIDPLSRLTVGEKNYTEDDSSSSLTVKLGNNSLDLIQNITVYVVLYDKDSNAIGFSKTQIDEIASHTSVLAPFTWPMNRSGRVISIEALPVAE